MTTITDTIRELRELLAKATPGPLYADRDRVYTDFFKAGKHSDPSTVAQFFTTAGIDPFMTKVSEIALYVLFRNALPQLLEASEKAERYEKALRFYSEGKHFLDTYHECSCCNGGERRDITLLDEGETAKKAIAPEQGEQ